MENKVRREEVRDRCSVRTEQQKERKKAEEAPTPWSSVCPLYLWVVREILLVSKYSFLCSCNCGKQKWNYCLV